jgi:peroxiredoxin
MNRLIAVLLLVIATKIACAQHDNDPSLNTGIWRATLLRDGHTLPFQLDIQPNSDKTTYTVHAINGLERIKFDTAYFNKDSLIIPMALFDSKIIVKPSGELLVGRYIRYSLGKEVGSLPFKAQSGLNYRFFKNPAPTSVRLSSKWAAKFKKPGAETTDGVGVFEQNGNEIRGSVLTPTGDYRYLAGEINGDSLFLSTFDASNSFLLKAKIESDGTLNGEFWSGFKGYKTWTARADSAARLADVSQLTYLKPGYETIRFSFPDATGKCYSVEDPTFRNKVVILQILGSWCPNCMDETNFLAPWYKKNKHRGIEIIGLAFESSDQLTVSGPKLKRMAERYSVDYPVLLAGANTKESQAAALPMLNNIMAYPTTLIIDKQGKIRSIHTGFSGPGTGKYYEEFIEEFNRLIDKLLAE